MTPSLLSTLCRPLAAVRPTIVDPTCGDGELLRAAATSGTAAPRPYSGTENLLGMNPDRGLEEQRDGVAGPNLRLWRAHGKAVGSGDAGLAEGLLEEVRCMWDSVVARVADPDHARAVWDLIQRRISKKGEALVIALTPAAAEAVSGEPGMNRVWAIVGLPGGTTALYLAADHRPGPKQVPETVAANDEVEAATLLVGLQARRRQLISGSVVEAPHHTQSETAVRFEAARDECLRRQRKGPAFNLWLTPDGRLQVDLSAYQRFAADRLNLNPSVVKALHGKFPMDLVVQRSTRIGLQAVSKSTALRVHSAVFREIDRCIGEYQAQRAPFIRLNDVQRLGYLDEEDAIVCTTAAFGFEVGRSYKIWTSSEATLKKEHRLREDGKTEVVEVRGLELVVKLAGDRGTHEFRQYPQPGNPETQHSLAELVQFFAVPDVQDVADCRPQLYAEMKDCLLALQG
jgi:hypothetical protein